MEADIKSGYVRVNGVNIHYLSAGEGSPVFLLHGGGTDSACLSWRLSIGPISRGHRVFAPDWPGYGNSDKPKIKYTTQYYLDFLGRLMNVLQVERASLVGISLGGAISLGFALESPHRVDRLVLVDSHGLGREVPLGIMGYLLVRLPFLLEMTWKLEGWSRAVVKRSLRSIFSNPQAVTEELVDEVYQLIKKPGTGRAFASWQRNEVTLSGLRTNFVDRLHEISVPTLIIHGAEDKQVPVSWARRAHGLIVGSELHIIPKCGHWASREKPEEFTTAILKFLGGSKD